MIKLRDHKTLNIEKFIKIAWRRLNHRQNAEDEFYNAYLELLKQDKEYNDVQHLEASLGLRIISRRLDTMNEEKAKEKAEELKSMRYTILNVYYKKYSGIRAWECNYDANKILEHLSIKPKRGQTSKLKPKVFEMALDCSDRGIRTKISKELGISKQNYKTALLEARHIAKEFYYKELK
jgi:hypothetical protein